MTLGFPCGISSKERTCPMQERLETGVCSLGWEGSMEKGKETHSSILAWRIPWTEQPGKNSPWGFKESDMTEAT